MRSGNNRDSRTLNRREMIAAGFALGLTGSSLADPSKSNADESIQNPATDTRDEGLASVKGPSALLNKRLEETSITGSTRACGRTYGRVFGDWVHSFMSLDTKPSDSRLSLAMACLPYIKKYTPHSYKFLRGSAEGSGFSLEHMTLFTLHEEHYHDWLALAQQEGREHCTAFVSSRTRSHDDRTIVAQNWDMGPEHFPCAGLLRLACDGKPKTITFHHPGLWSGCGINSEGLAHMWTGSGYYPPVKTVPGVPSYILISELLTKTSVLEAVKFLQETPNAGCYIFLLGDATGKTAVIEGIPERRPRVDYSSISFRTNQYEDPDLMLASRQNLNDPHATSSKIRRERASSILHSCGGRLSVDVLKTALTTRPIFRDILPGHLMEANSLIVAEFWTRVVSRSSISRTERDDC